MAGAASFFLRGDAVLFHRLVFLQLLPVAAYCGFLLTAMPDWTDYTGRLKTIGCILAAPLAFAALSLPFFPQASAFAAAACWIILFLFCSWLVWRGRNSKQFAVLLLLALFAAVQTAYAHTGDWRLLRTLVHLNIAAVMLVSFRVSIVLGAEALKECRLKDPVFIPNFVYKNTAILFLLLYAAAELLLPAQAAGFMALAAGFTVLAKLRELHHWELLRKHYVAFYYLIQLAAALGYLWLGACTLLEKPQGAPLHLITVGAMLGAVMLIFLTAGLRHSGFARLDYPAPAIAAFVCLAAAAVCRTVLQAYHPLFLMAAPAVLLAAAFALYLYCFIPIFRANAFSDDPDPE
ncbi:NnrS family protein [Kingella potus]|uniref:NnrS family protein n=1 Tax=Kingella potus TaxID=265175 RepID=UPI001FCFF2DA|nr:NnrS family protein [Kingella potus]UOP01796.1 NnrS family protein [Kingella potus]